jgi:hypothetical protein
VNRLGVALPFIVGMVLLLAGAFLFTSSGLRANPVVWLIAVGVVSAVSLFLLGFGVVRLNRKMSDY